MNMTPTAKIDKWDYIEKFLHSEGNNRVKRQHTEWRKIFANNKCLISKI